VQDGRRGEAALGGVQAGGRARGRGQSGASSARVYRRRWWWCCGRCLPSGLGVSRAGKQTGRPADRQGVRARPRPQPSGQQQQPATSDQHRLQLQLQLQLPDPALLTPTPTLTPTRPSTHLFLHRRPCCTALHCTAPSPLGPADLHRCLDHCPLRALKRAALPACHPHRPSPVARRPSPRTCRTSPPN
jgi:hypothetical protein